MAKAKHFPPVQYLHECFAYDPDTGLFRWRRRPEHHFQTPVDHVSWNKRWAGAPAFTVQVGRGARYLAGRVSYGGVPPARCSPIGSLSP